MSGAEALVVIGIISNIASIIDFAVKVYDRAQGFGGDVRDIPQEFQEVRRSLPLISNTLQKTSRHVESGQVDEETCKALQPLLDACKVKIKELSTIFRDVLPEDSASKWTRGWKAVSSMGQNKKVKVIIGSIWDDVKALTYYHVAEAATASQLNEAMSTMTISKIREPLFMVRYERVEDFIGREEIMKDIEKQFDGGNRVALAGIGGVGKSRIAIEYCYQYKSQVPQSHILWVHGGSRTRFETAYEEIARKLDISGLEHHETSILRLLTDWLSVEFNGPWLLVLDNVDDAELWVGAAVNQCFDSGVRSVPLAQYLPRGSHGHLLITTRDHQLGKQLIGTRKKPITILPFGKTEAILLLHSKTSVDDDISTSDASEIVEALEYLPLAITQAAAYLDQTEMSVAEYLRLLKKGQADEFDLLQSSVHDPSRDYEIQNAVFQTWKISFDQISKQNPRSADLLSLMVMLDRQSIPAMLMQQSDESTLHFVNAIQKLKAFSFIAEEVKTSVFSMHRLVQLSVKKWLEYRSTALKWRKAALDAVCTHLPESTSYQSVSRWESITPHIRAVLEHHVTDQVSLLQRATIMARLGLWEHEQRRFWLACELLKEAHYVRKKVLGPENPSVLTNAIDLAIVYSDMGHMSLAHHLFQEASASCEKFYGRSNEKTLGVAKRLFFNSILLDFQEGGFAEAEDKCIQLLGGLKPTLETTHPWTLDAIHHLAMIYARQGKFREAESMYLREINVLQETTGLKDTCGLRANYSLGLVHQEQGAFLDAERLYRQALTGYLEISGPDHRWTLNVLGSLGSLFLHQGDFIESEKFCLRALAGYKSPFVGPGKRKIAGILAVVYRGMGRLEDEKTMTRLVFGTRLQGALIVCDSCNNEISELDFYYFCFICNGADFDLCQSCVDGGAKCRHDSHLLVKRWRTDRLSQNVPNPG